MAMIKTPVKGMPEQLPADMEIREYALNMIKETYGKFGFSLIETPVIEHIENLTNKQGGENESLIFKILKRGEKLKEAGKETADSTDANDLCDSGLRYDLTVPLSRFFVNNMNLLPYPFKAMQLGSSFRADKPQKGRFRQFTQCDIDIIGDGSNLAEIELISATAEMLHRLGMGNFKIRVNDRRILKAMSAACGFATDKFDEICIILDKMDKIGVDGVEELLRKMELGEDGIAKYCAMLADGTDYNECRGFVEKHIGESLETGIADNMDTIIGCVRAIVEGRGEIVFDPSLVRGMGYYTGPIFEIELVDKKNYSFSIAGGGRYDEMIGKFSEGKINAPACGFSIGFERIVTILKDKGFKPERRYESVAYLLRPGLPAERVRQVIVEVSKLRDEGCRVLISPKAKNIKAQIEKLEEYGYTRIVKIEE